MKNRFVVGNYQIEYCSVQCQTAFRARVSVRLKRRHEDERVVTYIYFSEFDSAETALAEARWQAERVRARPRAHLH